MLRNSLKQIISSKADQDPDSSDRSLQDQALKLLDTEYYLEKNPDIAQGGIDPASHFENQGLGEAREPSALFSNPHYLGGDEDLGKPPIQHFLEGGGRTGRNPHPLFDTQFYLSRNPDIAESDLNPYLHFLSAPADEGRNPHPIFDIKWYASNHPDVSATGFDLLNHYIKHGDKAGDTPHPLFMTNYYLEQVDNHEAEGFNSLIHYILCGPMSNASPNPILDHEWYREKAPEIIEQGQTQLTHYLTSGAADGFDPSPLFHTWWYAERYLEGNAGGLNPLQHFMTKGHENNANPNPFFLTKWYRETYMGDSENEGKNPLLQYKEACEVIRKEMINSISVSAFCNPNPWLETAWYFAEDVDILHSKITPLGHYAEVGADERKNPGPNFNASWYHENYDTLGASALEHFLHIGAVKGNAPNELWKKAIDADQNGVEMNILENNNDSSRVDPRQYKVISESDLFDREWYIETYLAPENIVMDPVEHYILYGAGIGHNPSTRFNTIDYRTVNHDLRSADINLLYHYIEHGRFEGRKIAFEIRSDEVTEFRFSKPEYGPITDILKYDSDIELPSNLEETICVHLHLFHSDMAEEFCDTLNYMTTPYTLLVSIQEHESEEEWQQYFIDHITHASSVIVKNCPNRGRDVSPWLIYFREEIEAHDIFCHLHTKKSGYNKFQQSWRHYLTHTMFGTKTIVNQILGIFADNRDAGLIAPAYFYVLRNQPNYGLNYDNYERLYMALFGNIPEETCPDYPAGSFFWARTKMLEPLFELDLQLDDFDEEDGQVDGTIAHALERILGALPAYTDFKLRCIAVDVPFDLTRYIHIERVDDLNQELLLPESFFISAYDRPRYEVIEKRKIAVYSAITGGYENYMRPLVLDPNIDYFLFTDTPEKFDPDWATVIETPYHGSTPVRTARYIKTHPHFWFPEYDYAIWMDANILPIASLYPFVNKLEGTAHEATFIPHPLRFNFMEEGMELLKFDLDNKYLIQEQIARYGKIEGVMEEELIETNLFICRPQLEVTRTFMSLWWSELNNYSHRDQLSINYALLKSGLKWTPLFEENISVRSHEDFFLLQHEMTNREEFLTKLTQVMNTNKSKEGGAIL